jgi:IMP dehydrogenase
MQRQVSEVMTRENLITAPEGTTLLQAEEILQDYKIEKLPVVDAEGHVCRINHFQGHPKI